jgi:hypothetical protein
MADGLELPDNDPAPDAPGPRVLVLTTTPLLLEVRELDGELVPRDKACMGTFLDAKLIARCVAPPGAVAQLLELGVFGTPRHLALTAREADPGLQCELFAVVPAIEEFRDDEDANDEAEDDREPWAASVPSSAFDLGDFDRPDGEAGTLNGLEGMTALLLGSIVRFRKDRKFPDDLVSESVDVLTNIVTGQVVHAVDKALEDLLGGELP